MAYRPDPQCTVGEQAAQGPGSRSTARNWLANFALAVLFLLLALALLMVWT